MNLTNNEAWYGLPDKAKPAVVEMKTPKIRNTRRPSWYLVCFTRDASSSKVMKRITLRIASDSLWV